MARAHHLSTWTLAALGVAALAAGCAAMEGGAGETAERPSPGCAPGRAVAAGTAEFVITSGGEERRYLIHAPRSYTGEEAVPLVLDLQMSGGSPERELAVTGFDQAAEGFGFLLVAPAAVRTRPGGATTWNVPHDPAWPDDVAFVDDLLDTLVAEVCIDKARIYATGFSGGARFASELACLRPERFAAIAVVGGLRHPMGAEGRCPGVDDPVSILALHGVPDPVNAYTVEGAPASPYWTYGAEEALARWAAQMECGASRTEAVAPDAQRTMYVDCRGGADLVFYRLENAGHVWPGSAFAFSEAAGPAEPDVDATAIAAAFFAARGE